MGKWFGTDGIRGIANKELDGALAFKVGKAAAEVLARETKHRPRFLIGKDTRISGDMLEAALAAGLCSVGADVVKLGVIPTPAVAYFVKKMKADAGVMISASHNPMEYNGIKIFGADGCKLGDALEEAVEKNIEEDGAALKLDCNIGCISSYESKAAQEYAEFVSNTVEGKLSGLRVLIDCSNGSASATARLLFDMHDIEADFICDTPDGLNINKECGSTHLKRLSQKVIDGGYDVGIAFDGDADRCLFVDDLGNEVDGDQIIALCAMELKAKGELAKDSVVLTVMSNLGRITYLKENGITPVLANVGDRFVLEEMQKQGIILGGEQSGHVIFLKEATTGDGQLTAMKLLEVINKSGKKLSELILDIPVYPQKLVNIKVTNGAKKATMESERLSSAVRLAEEKLGASGRVLIRASGTEALIRVMVEAEEENDAETLSHELAEMVRQIAGV